MIQAAGVCLTQAATVPPIPIPQPALVLVILLTALITPPQESLRVLLVFKEGVTARPTIMAQLPIITPPPRLPALFLVQALNPPARVSVLPATTG